ncbi:uncharacterized protein MAM_04383 [Metarhizium album ARSEF 1941]|uniref:Uncharacterized protein n=1 Tax=Metarhizium album (strain ARSEF 1941) TaxID=1081103 RepID=A0A0B2WWK0_METAS|nr:uncharacterized protein MAM_04383 [Metarhizium album ARSEF 1941]KHN97994.1 hypothetical protein MAM_04383 [Metarhizium album ARSEF 1941]
MPTYLCHGFRWYRRSIRVFVILNDLEDCTPDWIIGRDTAAVILSQFAESFDFVPRLENEDGTVARPESSQTTPPGEKRPRPQCYDDELAMPTSKVPGCEDNILVHEWSPVKLLEEYDMNEVEHAARPYAYVADHVVRVDLGVDIAAEIAAYENAVKDTRSSWFEKLRDQVQAEEQSRWYVVVCDDTDRQAPENCDEGDEVPSEVAAAARLPPSQVRAQPGVMSRMASATLASDQMDLGYAWRGSSGSRPDAPTQPTFLDQDPFRKELPATPRLKKKLSIRRLFSKKDA